MARKKTRSRNQQTASTTVAPSTAKKPTNPTSAVPVKTTSTALQTGSDEKRMRDLSRLTKEQLRTECRKRGRKTSGTKIELVQRLSSSMVGQRKDVSSTTSNGNLVTSTATSTTSANVPKAVSNKTNGARKRKSALIDERTERDNLVIWKRPLTTLYYFAMEVFTLMKTYGIQLYTHRISVSLVVISVLVVGFVSKLSGPHQVIIEAVYRKLLWCLYWTGLGILSSVGLGTGLHTFLLYLGPHIAQVTLAAYECGSVNFPEPPYPDDIICPSGPPQEVSIFAIMSKVRLEAMCWGAGTALGELPPYFMARAARLSGLDPDEDDDLKELEELQNKSRDELTLIERGKIFVEEIVQKVGFLGILACASIPNPLFDLAGITCGHFLVPFWTFFGATLIGKAIVKMHIQKLFVIVAFNETLITTALGWLMVVPVFGRKLQEPFRAFLDGQKTRLHRGKSADAASGPSESGNLLSAVFEKFVFAMILYFVVSIVNSLAQSYHKRVQKARKIAAD